MRFTRLIPIAVVAACLLPAAPVLAQDEKPKDHPRFSGMPSYQISNLDEQEFGAGSSRSAGASRRSTSRGSTGGSTTG